MGFALTIVSFGNQPVGIKSLPKTITVSNEGSVAIDITGIFLAGSNPGDFTETNTCGKEIAAGSSCSVTVTFVPSAEGGRFGAVSVTDDGGGSPQRVTLNGTGT